MISNRYNFASVGGDITDALMGLMQQQKAEQRQAMLDALHQKDVESQMADREMNRKIQADTLESNKQYREALTKQQEENAKITHANSVKARLEQMSPGMPVSPETVDEMKATGFGDFVKPGQDVVEGFGEGGAPITSPGQATFTGTESQKHQQELMEQKQKLADAANEIKKAHEEAYALAQQGRLTDAQHKMDMANAALEAKLKLMGLQGELTQSKIDAAGQKQADLEKAKQTGLDSKAEVGRLASEIFNNKHLNDVLGPYAGFMPSARSTSVDLDAKIKRLNSMLSLENRQQLKGSGAISDFEAKMLEAAASVLGNQRVSPETYRAELQRVMGLAPAAPAGAPGAGGAGDRVTVVHPDGRRGTIPRAQLQDAIAQGYKVQ